MYFSLFHVRLHCSLVLHFCKSSLNAQNAAIIYVRGISQMSLPLPIAAGRKGQITQKEGKVSSPLLPPGPGKFRSRDSANRPRGQGSHNNNHLIPDARAGDVFSTITKTSTTKTSIVALCELNCKNLPPVDVPGQHQNSPFYAVCTSTHFT